MGASSLHSNLDLAALIGSRICHDLISPIGAIGNGLELLAMDGMRTATAEMSLISESFENASARIRLFRVAFGAAGGGQSIAVAEARMTIAGYLQGGRLEARWQPDRDLPRGDVQLAYLALMCFETAMPLGGVVQFEHDGAGWTITGQAARLRAEPGLWQALATAQGPQEVSPAQVQFALLPILAQEAGRPLGVEIGEDSLVLRV